jgi:glycine dehydrogenase subunit 1
MRYLPLTEEDRSAMLNRIGATGMDDLFRDVPEAARLDGVVDLPPHMGEMEVERELGRMAARNRAAGDGPFFIGAGAYRHHIPASVDHIIQRSEFLTSYTPYQPEIAQGTTQYLFEFQTQVALITGMDVANASMYDGSTSAAEAVAMARRVTRRRKAVLAGGLHPHYRSVIETHARILGDEVVAGAPAPDGQEDLIGRIDEETSCVVIQTPDFFGNIHDLRRLADAAHEKGALLIAVVTEAVSLGALTPPGEMGADIVAAEGQSIGNGLNFGGPYVGLFATREKLVRQMPGRVSGETVDTEGRRGYVLTLSTREQHIRREKATSNICTNSGLCSLAFTIHMALLNHQSAVQLAERLEAIPGVDLVTPNFFNEFTLRLKRPAAEVVDALAGWGVLGGVPVSRLIPDDSGMKDLLVVAATETNTDEDRAAYAAALKEVLA